MPDLPREWVRGLPDSLSLLPTRERRLERTAPLRAGHVHIVVARHGDAGRQRLVPDPECCCGRKHLGVETEHRRVAREDEVIEPARGQVVPQHVGHGWCVLEPNSAAEDVDVHPPGRPLAENVPHRPPEMAGGQVNVAEMGQFHH